MTGKITVIPRTDDNVERGSATPMLAVGQWFWLKAKKKEWFGCLMDIGSNYVEIRAPSLHGYQSARVHFGDIEKEMRKEENPKAVIQSKINYWSSESARLIGEVKKLTAQLGLKTTALPATANGSGTELVAMSGQADIKAYKKALVKASEKTLPELFEKIKDANKQMATWMTVETYPMQAQVTAMEEVLGEVKDRIFNVSLYAGLAEDAVKCCDGKPAAIDEKLHVFQRRLYMDEECLLNYQAGGMEFKNINKFDDWISKPENRDRILPFQRTIVAMRVRREAKERDCDGSMVSAFIKMNLEESDRATFLYIRNGEQVWRISCELDFGEMIFPDKSLYDPSQPMMMKLFCGSINQMMTVNEYEAMLEEQKKNPEGWEYRDFGGSDWHPFDQSSVYFDDAMADIAKQIKEYNRIAVIIQGLFDRSLILHPHAKVESWKQGGFDQAIKLVYDAHMVLDNGDPPDFDAYRAACNKSITASSVLTGQHAYWLDSEKTKEKKRRINDYRLSESERYSSLNWWTPMGNDGPVEVGVPNQWNHRTKRATFSWFRERVRYSRFEKGDLPANITVPVSRLFNISAYKVGDYKQFFQDHRTRQQYLKWAPILLAAEDFHGKKS